MKWSKHEEKRERVRFLRFLREHLPRQYYQSSKKKRGINLTMTEPAYFDERLHSEPEKKKTPSKKAR